MCFRSPKRLKYFSTETEKLSNALKLINWWKSEGIEERTVKEALFCVILMSEILKAKRYETILVLIQLVWMWVHNPLVCSWWSHPPWCCVFCYYYDIAKGVASCVWDFCCHVWWVDRYFAWYIPTDLSSGQKLWQHTRIDSAGLNLGPQ